MAGGLAKQARRIQGPKMCSHCRLASDICVWEDALTRLQERGGAGL